MKQNNSFKLTAGLDQGNCLPASASHCFHATEDHVFHFDSEKEVSGMKFSLEDISPGLPANWDDYEFVVLEFMITTPQRFQVGFTTERDTTNCG